MKRTVAAFAILPLFLTILRADPDVGLSSTQTVFVSTQSSTKDDTIAALEQLPPGRFTLQEAPLGSALRFLGDACGISYIGLPDGEASKTKISFDIRGNPFDALKTVAKGNGISLILEDGTWYFRPVNDSELIARTYNLKNDDQEVVTAAAGNSQGDATTATSTASGGNSGNEAVALGSGSSSSSSPSGTSMNSVSFSVDTKRLVDEVTQLIGIPTTGQDALIAPSASVTSGFPSLGNNEPNLVNPSEKKTGSSQTKANDSSNGSKVIYNSDTSSLFVVATRQQHEWVQSFISTIDKPQKLIAIEVKIFASTKDPLRESGIDWSNTLQGGYSVALAGDTAGKARISSNVDFTHVGHYQLPTETVLSFQALNVAVKAFMDDNNTVGAAYPRSTTLSNRQVIFSKVTNLNYNNSTTVAGSASTTSDTAQFIPVGTTTTILPKVRDDGTVQMAIGITDSDSIGTNPLTGIPTTEARTYTGQAIVKSGYTLVIGGLESASANVDRNKVPFFGDIPLIGELFKSAERKNQHVKVTMFITPIVLPDYAGGLPDAPVSTVPSVGEAPKVYAYYDGHPGVSENQLYSICNGISEQVELLDAKATEGRASSLELSEVTSLRAELKSVAAELDRRTLNREIDQYGQALRPKISAINLRLDATVKDIKNYGF